MRPTLLLFINFAITDDSILVPVAVVIVAGPGWLDFELFKSLYPRSHHWPDLNILEYYQQTQKNTLWLPDLLIKPVHVYGVQVGVVWLLGLGGRLAAEVVTPQPLPPDAILQNVSKSNGGNESENTRSIFPHCASERVQQLLPSPCRQIFQSANACWYNKLINESRIWIHLFVFYEFCENNFLFYLCLLTCIFD